MSVEYNVDIATVGTYSIFYALGYAAFQYSDAKLQNHSTVRPVLFIATNREYTAPAYQGASDVCLAERILVPDATRYMGVCHVSINIATLGNAYGYITVVQSPGIADLADIRQIYAGVRPVCRYCDTRTNRSSYLHVRIKFKG